MKKSTRKVTLESQDKFTVFVKEHIKSDVVNALAHKFGVSIRLNNIGMLVIKGDKAGSEKLQNQFKVLKSLKRNIVIDDLHAIVENRPIEDDVMEAQCIDVSSMALTFRDKTGKTSEIKPKTAHQIDLISSILTNKVTLALGSAGTGKSMVSLAVGLKLLETGVIKKIMVTKPAVDAGPEIGFLPGDESTKLAPYTASVMNLIGEIIGPEKRDKYLKNGMIEVQNLGFLRGITLGSVKTGGVFFLLDEAQNIDFQQNKMILSRLGDHPESRLVYAGDQFQSDLKYKKDTLSLIHHIIKDSPYVGSVIFTRDDIVRSPTVKDLMERMETYEESERMKKIK